MTRTILFLSPHFPPHFCNFIRCLREAELTVLGIGDDPYTSLDEALKENLCEYFEVCCMEDYDEVYRGVAHLIAHHGRIDWVQSHNEHWLRLESQLRLDFNICTGYHPCDLEKFQRKSAMKHIFASLGLNVPAGKVMTSLDEVLEFVKAVGYPIIVKPDRGVGSCNTFKLEDRIDLDKFFTTTFLKEPQDYIFEEFIEGELVTFDGLADKRGGILCCGTMKWFSGLLDCSDMERDIFSLLNRELPADLLQAGSILVSAFRVSGHFFHFEFFRQHTGRLVALEVNLRLIGGRGIDMYNFAFDIDLYQMWANVVADRLALTNGNRALTKPLYNVFYASRRDHKPYAHSHEQVTEEIVWDNKGVQLMAWYEVPLPFRRTGGDLAYIFRAKEESCLINLSKELFLLDLRPRPKFISSDSE